MRSMEARKEEVYRRGQRRMQARRKRRQVLSGACGAAVLCVLVFAISLPRQPKATEEITPSAIPEMQTVSASTDMVDEKAEIAEPIGPVVTVSVPGQEAIRLSNPAPVIDALRNAFANTGLQNKGEAQMRGDDATCTITVTLETGESERYKLSGATLTRTSDDLAIYLSDEALKTLEALLELEPTTDSSAPSQD